MLPDTLTGPVILTRYMGPTDHRPARVAATHRRDSGRTIRATLAWDHSLSPEGNHRAAALACLARAEFSQPLTLAARGHDHECYAWVAVGLWQLEPAALALTACRELLAALAGGGDAEALALPAALARMATGAAPVRPVVTGWAILSHRVALTDALGEAVLTLPDTYSPAGALAAAQAAGWQLTAEARAVAARHPGQPDPAGVAEALAALGGCPAVVAALDPARGLL